MTEKRFKIDLDEEAITDNGEFCLSLYCFQDKGEKDVCDLLNELAEENGQLKKENSVFQGKDAKHYQRWVNQIKKYVEEDNPDFTYDDDFIIKIALSYTLQSVRNGESLKRFQWEWKE